MSTLRICSPHLSDAATLPWEMQKKSFFQHYYSYASDYLRLLRRKRVATIFSAALAVYLLLFNASYYLHSPSTMTGARHRRSACIDTDMLRLAAAACCDMG